MIAINVVYVSVYSNCRLNSLNSKNNIRRTVRLCRVHLMIVIESHRRASIGNQFVCLLLGVNCIAMSSFHEAKNSSPKR